MATAPYSGAGVTYGVQSPKLSQMIKEVYSRDILFHAQPVMKYDQFSVKKTELQTLPGQTINFTKYNNIALGGTLLENEGMTTKTLSAQQTSISVGEYGNAISVTELLLQTAFTDVLEDAARLLGRDYARVVDNACRDILRAGLNVIYANRVAGRSSIAKGLSTADIKDAVEVLTTNDAPLIGGEYWVVFVHPHQARAIRDDAAWINASNYGAPTQIFLGEVGRYENVRFIETTNVSNGAAASSDPAYDSALADAGSGSADIYQAVMLGDNAFAHALALPVELRDNGIEDFGRKHSLAWYSIEGFGRVEEESLVRLETA